MRLHHFLSHIRSNLDMVRRAGLSDDIRFYASLHALQIACQCLLDMASLVSAALGKPPSSYSEAGSFLAEEGAFDEGDLRKYKGIVGFRNVLVHNYLQVDRELVREVVEEGRFEDIELLALKVIKFAELKGIDP